MSRRTMTQRSMALLRGLLPRHPRAHRIKGGPLRGMTIHTSWQDYPRAILGSAEAPLCRWFGDHVRPGETWLDIGAHHGVTALCLAKCVGSTGRVFAFEPELTSAGLLAATRRANGLESLFVLPLALGDVEALTGVRVSSAAQGMIGITPAMRRGEYAADLGQVIWETSLDAIWPSICGEDRIDGIKVDVQGAESHTLRGMRETLRRHRPRLIVEYHDYADRDELLGVLEDLGYDPCGLDIDLPDAPPTSRWVHGHNYLLPLAGESSVR